MNKSAFSAISVNFYTFLIEDAVVGNRQSFVLYGEKYNIQCIFL